MQRLPALGILAVILGLSAMSPSSASEFRVGELDAHPHIVRGDMPSALDSHSDGTYNIPVWFNWNTYVIDVWVVPPVHGQLVNGYGALGGYAVPQNALELTPLNSYLAATLDSINDWKRAVQMYGSASLKSNLQINTYVVGLDLIPPNADPEVLIVADETKGPILGWAWSFNPCLVDNSMFFTQSFSYADMFNVNGQEFGHCLGLQHVVNGHPTHDDMNGAYPHTPGAFGTRLHCISNLDVAGLERVFTGLRGEASLPVSQYDTTSWSPNCEYA